jgi:hypothetical protein
VPDASVSCTNNWKSVWVSPVWTFPTTMIYISAY